MMPIFETPRPITVDVELGVGDIRIDASERTDTVVEVLPSDPGKPGDVTAAEQTRIDLAGGRLVIRGRAGGGSGRPGGPRAGASRSTCVSRCPQDRDPGRGRRRRSALHRRARRAPVQDRRGRHRRRSGRGRRDPHRRGDVRIGHTAGDLAASTGSGVVRIAAVDGSAVIKISNREPGSATWAAICAYAANGSITVDRAGASVTVKTANGDISLGEVAPGAVVAQTAAGKIDVGIREGIAAWLDLDTGFGRVDNDLADTESPRRGRGNRRGARPHLVRRHQHHRAPAA